MLWHMVDLPEASNWELHVLFPTYHQQAANPGNEYQHTKMWDDCTAVSERHSVTYDGVPSW